MTARNRVIPKTVASALFRRRAAETKATVLVTLQDLPEHMQDDLRRDEEPIVKYSHSSQEILLTSHRLLIVHKKRIARALEFSEIRDIECRANTHGISLRLALSSGDELGLASGPKKDLIGIFNLLRYAVRTKHAEE